MSITEVMKFGCKDMTESQKKEEQERRIKVVERINKLGVMVNCCQDKKKTRAIKSELNRIKGAENVWLRQAGWFMYV